MKIDLNTTIVKVKQHTHFDKIMLFFDLNTTIVKVKHGK